MQLFLKKIIYIYIHYGEVFSNIILKNNFLEEFLKTILRFFCTIKLYLKT